MRLFSRYGCITPSEPSIASNTETPSEGVRIEAQDAERVTPSGEWVYKESDAASDGAYLFSGSNPDDTLTMQFNGTAITIVYVQHPGLSSFDVVIDGETVQTVTLTGSQNFGERALIAELPDSEHTLMLVPHEGVIARDAFIIGTE
jgi:hypothetical protein